MLKNVTHNCSFSVLVLHRKVRSSKLVMDEDESTTDSQFAFSRSLTNNFSSIQEHFNSHYGKVSIFARMLTHRRYIAIMERMNRILNLSVKIVVTTGRKFRNSLSNNDPWKGKECVPKEIPGNPLTRTQRRGP